MPTKGSKKKYIKGKLKDVTRCNHSYNDILPQTAFRSSSSQHSCHNPLLNACSLQSFKAENCCDEILKWNHHIKPALTGDGDDDDDDDDDDDGWMDVLAEGQSICTTKAHQSKSIP